MATTSITLLERVVRGGRDEDWQRLIQIYSPLIRSQINRFPSLSQQFEDIVQDSLLVLLTELPSFQRRRLGSFRTWLRQIVLNQLRYALRRAKRHPISEADLNSTQQQIEELALATTELSKAFDAEHDRFVFQRACDLVRTKVEEKTWQAFYQYAILNQSPDSVSKSLGMSVNSVQLAKSRVLAKIRTEIDGFVDRE
jgi:RNA polymerase sigma-70 factor, ECF subfamily